MAIGGGLNADLGGGLSQETIDSLAGGGRGGNYDSNGPPPDPMGAYELRELRSLEWDPIIFERWQTAADERTCPECAPLEGWVFQEGDGWYPPLHRNCRCVRVLDHIEYTARELWTQEWVWNPWA